MRHTDFAGLTELDPGESIALDDYGLQARNPRVIDFFLRLGAQLHRHDGHAALTTPTTPVGLAASNTGGTLPGGVDATIAYTALDTFGGETLISPEETIALPAAMAEPDSIGTAVIDYTGGSLTVGTYYYVKTWVDGMGGETLASPITEVPRDPGAATAQVQLSGLLTAMPAGATGWRLYKSSLGGLFGFLVAGATNTYTDDGVTDCADASQRPPSTNTTNSANRLTISVPAAAAMPAGTVGFRIYGALGIGTYTDPALLREEPIANAGTDYDVTAWNPQPGSPPVLPTSVAGAQQIDPDTELLDFPWKRPVATASALPTIGSTTGDARVTLDDLHIHLWDGAAWQDLTNDSLAPGPWIPLPVSPVAAPNWTRGADLDHIEASYYRTRDGIVRFRGMMFSSSVHTFGAADATVAEMPAGYRPDIAATPNAQSLEFLCPFANSALTTWYIVRVKVWGNGKIIIDGDFSGGSSLVTGFIDLSGIHYRARLPLMRFASDQLGTHD